MTCTSHLRGLLLPHRNKIRRELPLDTRGGERLHIHSRVACGLYLSLSPPPRVGLGVDIIHRSDTFKGGERFHRRRVVCGLSSLGFGLVTVSHEVYKPASLSTHCSCMDANSSLRGANSPLIRGSHSPLRSANSPLRGELV
eukprot:1193735-Prorocentrum_minimum.AAC.4